MTEQEKDTRLTAGLIVLVVLIVGFYFCVRAVYREYIRYQCPICEFRDAASK
jgi:hypothetical protein